MFFVIDSFEKGPAINDVGNFFQIFDPTQKLFRATHFIVVKSQYYIGRTNIFSSWPNYIMGLIYIVIWMHK